MTTAQVPNLARRIAQARRESGFTQVGLAEAVGYKPRTIQAWEGGTRTPRSPGLERIAAQTGKPLSWFYMSDEELEPVAA
jgi:transcriptional regulator with XRE-family HTH domain